MRKYKLIGLTGTTGAGKGQARKVFEDYGYKVIDADLLARKIMENPIVLSTLTLHFGDDIVANGRLNRSLLAQRAFKDKESTALLNSITHPYIGALFVEQVKKFSYDGADKIIFDAPQLFESHLDVLCDCTVAVLADKDIRLKRIMRRDNISKEKSEKRMNVQLSDKFFRDNCDYIIENNRSLEELSASVQRLIMLL